MNHIKKILSGWRFLLGSWIGLLLVIVPYVDGEWIAQEIQYHGPAYADAVYLVWGIDGWQTVPEDKRPQDTFIDKDVMHTKMEGGAESFVAHVSVPRGATIDYGFLLVSNTIDGEVHSWEADGSEDFHCVADEGSLISVTSNLGESEAPVQSVDIRYRMPDALEVELVWGIDGWNSLPEEQLPANTRIRDQQMATAMEMPETGLFVAKIAVPLDSHSLDYGFLITRKQNGTRINVWEDGGSQDISTLEDPAIEIGSQVSLNYRPGFQQILKVVGYLLLGTGFLALLIVIITRAVQPGKPRTILLILLLLFIIGLLLRVGMGVYTNQIFPDTVERLVGDEPGYDYLATELLEGRFFQWPARTPIYPMFLAASYFLFGHSFAKLMYVQAVISALAIPLTYFLATKFTSKRNSLIAAAIVAINPVLIYHVSRVYSEAIYTPLLLLTAIALVWALQSPNITRFIIAGILAAILTLTRPVTILLPAVLLFIVPGSWTIRSRLVAIGAFAVAMVAAIAPWTYHNYKTYDAFVPLSASTYVLWQASPEYYHLMEEGYNSLQIFDAYVNPENNGGYDSSTLSGSSYFNQRGISSIRSEPLTYVEYSIKKLLYFWIGHPANHWEWPLNFDFQFQWVPNWQIAGQFFSRLLPIVTLVILATSGRHLRLFYPLLAIIVLFMLMHAISVPEVRYSEPLYPLLAIMVVAGSTYSVQRLRNKQPSQNDVTTATQPTKKYLTRFFSIRTNIGDLLRELVARDLRLRYRRSVLGIGWSLLNPLLQLLVLGLVFNLILPLDIENYALFLFTGLLAWIWFSSSLMGATTSIVDNRELIRRPGFPAGILPVVSITSNLIHYLLSLPVLLIMLLVLGVGLQPTIFLLPVIIILQFIFTLSLSVYLAVFQVTFRDTQHLVNIFLFLWFYLTPIFYDIDLIPERLRPLYALNPMAHIIEAYRAILMYGTVPAMLPLIIIGVLSTLMLLIGYRFLRRASDKFVEEL